MNINKLITNNQNITGGFGRLQNIIKMTNTNVYRESLNTLRKSYSFECYEGAKRVFKMRMPYKKWCEKSNEQIIHGELLDIHILDGVKIIVCKEYNTEKQYD